MPSYTTGGRKRVRADDEFVRSMPAAATVQAGGTPAATPHGRTAGLDPA